MAASSKAITTDTIFILFMTSPPYLYPDKRDRIFLSFSYLYILLILTNHPNNKSRMPKKPPELVYGVEDKPPLLTCLLLGLQQIFIITIVLVFPVVIVRSIGGTPEQAAFFC
jgi:hypothetical protein